MATFYQLLSVDISARPEEIKRAFRQEIALYHPDKVQHLGKEFQEMAASRAAQLTEAYRVLMNVELRAEYDRTLEGDAGVAASRSASSARPPAAEPSRPQDASELPTQAPPKGEQSARFSFERATRDEFVRKATIGKLRQVLEAELGGFAETPAKGFELSGIAKSKKLFARGVTQRVAAKFVAQVDRDAVRDAWSSAQKLCERGDVCVFLIGNSLATSRELAGAVADERKRSTRGCRVCLVPVDIRDWHALVPADAPAFCKGILRRLRSSAV